MSDEPQAPRRQSYIILPAKLVLEMAKSSINEIDSERTKQLTIAKKMALDQKNEFDAIKENRDNLGFFERMKKLVKVRWAISEEIEDINIMIFRAKYYAVEDRKTCVLLMHAAEFMLESDEIQDKNFYLTIEDYRALI